MTNKLSIRISVIIFLVTTFFLLSCSGKNSSEISKETNLIVKKIEKINVVMGSAVGSGGMKPEQYDNFQSLMNKASQEELILLTNHSNAVVRCYSFWALAYYENVDLFSIVKNHITDTTSVQTQFGCLASSEKTGDFFINLVNPKHKDSEIRKLTKEEFNKLDSILIYQKNNLYASNLAIENAVPSEYLYHKVRDLVIKNHSQSALITLSKYKNPNDIELILKNREKVEDEESGYFFTYKAIQNFPDSRFLPFLEKRLSKTLDDDHFDGEWLQLYTAIATFKNQKSLELLKIPFTKVKYQNIKKYHIEFVYKGILINKCKLYDDLLWEIWENEHYITLKGFEYLLQVNGMRTLELSKRELVPNYQLKKTTSVPKINQKMFTEKLDETLLNFIQLNDKAFSYNILKEKIANASVNDFEIYCAKVLELQDNSFIEILFKRLKEEDNPYVYIQIVETLISFKDASINKRILDTRKQNKNMNENWGSDSLDEILKKNNIK